MTDSARAVDAGFEEMVTALRPRLHRYCAGMTGSVIDGEDVLQEALLKAFGAIRRAVRAEELEPRLFRIAHNSAIDHLRRRRVARRSRTSSFPIPI